MPKIGQNRPKSMFWVICIISLTDLSIPTGIIVQNLNYSLYSSILYTSPTGIAIIRDIKIWLFETNKRN